MANRAYLFATDREDQWAPPLVDNPVYYDSRWSIPIAWWFLFTPDDIKRADVTGSRDVRLRTDKPSAVDRLVAARSVLNRVVANRLDARRLDFFELVIGAWTGRFLVMDPSEILRGFRDPSEDPDTSGWFHRILGRARERPFQPELFELETRSISWVDAADPDKIEAQITGYTYGQLADDLWKRILYY